MKDLERRVQNLEAASGSGLVFVDKRKGETLEEAMRRQGIEKTPGVAYIACGPFDWEI